MQAHWREHSGPIMVSVLLHGLLAGGLLLVTLMPKNKPLPSPVPLPLDAMVVDSQVLHAAQKAKSDRVEEEAARVRAAAEAKAAAEAAVVQQRADAAAADAAAAEAARTEAARAEAARAEAARAEAIRAEATRAEAARTAQTRAVAAATVTAAAAAAAAEQRNLLAAQKAVQVQKAHAAQQRVDADKAAAAEAQRTVDARQATDDKTKKDREAELRRQMADEERVSAVESGPLRDRYASLLRNKIQSAWIKPPSATPGVDCQVEVTQVAGGEVTGARVTQCNGDAAVRQSIENAVYRASPLPDPPDPALFERHFVLRFKPNE